MAAAAVLAGGPAGAWAATRRPCRSAGSSWPRPSWPRAAWSPPRWCWSPPRAIRPGGSRLGGRRPGAGPLAALAATFEALDAAEVLVLAGDHPGLRVELLAHLVALAPRGQAVACRRGPRPSRWSRSTAGFRPWRRRGGSCPGVRGALSPPPGF